MAKRRKARPFVEPVTPRAPTASAQRRKAPRKPPPSRSSSTPRLLGGAVVVGAAILVGAYFLGLIPGLGPSAGATPSPSRGPVASRGSGPFASPAATPLASPPAEPAGDGTTATIETDFGTIVIQLFNQSSPVAAANFANLAEGGYYNGLTFHRIVPNFVIQGGDPSGNGSGGPGYTIVDEPIVGAYGRGIVAMARTQAPNSQGSQFFIVVSDEATAALVRANTYAIFGRVTSGMEAVDAIVDVPLGGQDGETPLDPVVMNRVTVQRP